ncbi:DUF2905 domain-containing protein [Alkalicoccus daliensis]|uniref:DUF2905 domain-containing protein n=1 Tax=Alkalicoccus daliensis TaxID=745820 RepID=A0A1H0BL74_9BACI|nr:Protein of unknown function [Alkalicoccus daliensis]
MTIPKMLVTAGIVLIIAGVIWQVGGRFLSLGRLPGDIIIERGNSTFYFPLMTSIIISIVLSLLFMFFRR